MSQMTRLLVYVRVSTEVLEAVTAHMSVFISCCFLNNLIKILER